MSSALCLQTNGHLNVFAASMSRPLALMTEGYLCIDALQPIIVATPPIATGGQAGFGQWSPIQRGPWTPPIITEEEIFYRSDMPLRAAVETGLYLSGDNPFDKMAAMVAEELHLRKRR